MKVIVIGGGPAGMMAAIHAAQVGNHVILLEKMESLGKKLLITGKGRCNITSSLPIEDFIVNTPGNGNFLYSSFHQFTNRDMIAFLQEQGLNVKEERGHRIFPITDQSKDVLQIFLKLLKKYHVEIQTNTKVEEICVQNKEEENKKLLSTEKQEQKQQEQKVDDRKQEQEKNQIVGVKCTKNGKEQKLLADKVILATGGKSYPVTGSTGDGYTMAKALGHTSIDLKPSLVPLIVDKHCLPICKQLQGLSLKNVAIQLLNQDNHQIIYQDFGEMLFTHWGVSGPIILSSSAHLIRYKNLTQLLKSGKICLQIDLKPALSEEKLEERIIRDFSQQKNKEFKNSLDHLLPKKMIPVIIQLSNIDATKKVNSITKQEREKLVYLLKHVSLTLNGFRPIEEAIITSGGVSIKEISPKTMESKLVKGLYFAGEIIDVDAYTGGFNLQIAYSTGYVAGQ